MAKTIFFNVPTQGHLFPSQPIITELVRRGEHVIYVNAESARTQAEHTGAEFRAYPADIAANLQAIMLGAGSGNIPRNALGLLQTTEKLLPFAREMLQTENPDYVIYDSLCGWGKFATQISALPAISLNVTFVIGRGAMPATRPKILAQTLSHMFPVLPEALRVGRRLRQRYGIKGATLFGAVSNMGDLNIVFTSPEFQPASNNFNSTYKFVGASIGTERTPIEFPFEQLTSSPLIYISLGTVNNQNADFYRQCFAAFSGYPGQFVMSVGKKTDLNTLGSIPENFIVRNFVPQLQLLERAELFITHSGMGSVSEGLWYGVPLIAVPQQIEQSMVARRVQKLGAGIAVAAQPPFGRVTPEELRAAVDHILSDRERYHQNAKRLGDSLRQAGGYQRAADEILAFRSKTNSQ